MDWKDVGNAVLKIAPAVGTALLGPAGGAIGTILSSVFGTDPEPDKVMQAIKMDPNAALKLKEIESNNQTELQKAILQAETMRLAEETKQIQAVNQTMQVEAQHKGWPAFWRPFWGVISAVSFLVVSVFVCYLGYEAIMKGNPNAMTMIPQVISSMTMLFAVPGAILGVSAWHRGKMQRIQAGDMPQKSIVGALAERISKQ